MSTLFRANFEGNISLNSGVVHKTTDTIGNGLG